ncbi:DDE superfamily endonuclease [Hirsutella rhossiliensis]
MCHLVNAFGSLVNGLGLRRVEESSQIQVLSILFRMPFVLAIHPEQFMVPRDYHGKGKHPHPYREGEMTQWKVILYISLSPLSVIRRISSHRLVNKHWSPSKTRSPVSLKHANQTGTSKVSAMHDFSPRRIGKTPGADRPKPQQGLEDSRPGDGSIEAKGPLAQSLSQLVGHKVPPATPLTLFQPSAIRNTPTPSEEAEEIQAGLSLRRHCSVSITGKDHSAPLSKSRDPNQRLRWGDRQCEDSLLLKESTHSPRSHDRQFPVAESFASPEVLTGRMRLVIESARAGYVIPAGKLPVPRPTLFGIRKLPPPKNFDSPTSASLYLNQFTISSIAEMEARVQNALRYIENFPGAKADLLKLASELEIRGFPNQKRRPYFVTDAANCILRERSSQRDAPTVGPNWTSRFLKRHGYFKKRQKRLQAERQVSENLTRVNQYFQHLRQVIQDNGIPPEDIWNMDETGELIILAFLRIGNPLLRSKLSRRMGGCSGFLILAGQMHMASWYQIPELDPDTVIRPTPTGYSNDVISLEWLQHFDKHSEKSSRSSKRLLILDGHGSHHTRQFIEYCDNHNIIPFGMPPNLTHALQPLDVVVFQPLKHYHAKALDVMVRDGLVNITKLEFLSCIQQVRLHAFKESTIRSAFRKTGIFPFNPQVVLQCLEARQATTPTPPPNSGPHSSPFETPLTLRQINKVADKLDLVLEDDKSLDPDFSHDLSRFIRGSLSLATELVQTKRDLGRTKMAERIQKQRKAMKNIQLQSGGVLSVAQGREMVQQRGDDQIAKARKVVEDAEKKAHNARKRWKVRTSGSTRF